MLCLLGVEAYGRRGISNHGNQDSVLFQLLATDPFGVILSMAMQLLCVFRNYSEQLDLLPYFHLMCLNGLKVDTQGDTFIQWLSATGCNFQCISDGDTTLLSFYQNQTAARCEKLVSMVTNNALHYFMWCYGYPTKETFAILIYISFWMQIRNSCVKYIAYPRCN